MVENTQQKYCYDYPRPAVTVDVVLLRAKEEPALTEVLLIKRKSEPFKDRWALPGGFVDKEEALESAAMRELNEETGLSAEGLEIVAAFSDPGRDPRGHTVSIVFVGWTDHSANAAAGDDAKEVAWHSVDALPELAFDHDKIVAAVLAKLKN
ncbi:MAG: NUDIX hydrolase [Blastocatellia bacterium AA13]|nr:MAG: NUDIX hydrolase [Blastocatellia bacterium AA13]